MEKWCHAKKYSHNNENVLDVTENFRRCMCNTDLHIDRESFRIS